MSEFQTLEIGTAIFIPRVTNKEIAVECPDCGGSKHWHVSTTKGRNFMIDCPRCVHESGNAYDWMKPKRHEYVLEIEETTIKSIEIVSGPGWKDPEVKTRITYKVNAYGNTVQHDDVNLTREAAEVKGAALLDAAQTREKTDWDKDRERDAKRAGLSIIQAVEAKGLRRFKALDEKIDKLKEKMLEAIRLPSLYGPKISKTSTYAAPEITEQAMADWLGELLSDADIDGWTENELHEAMCHC